MLRRERRGEALGRSLLRLHPAWLQLVIGSSGLVLHIHRTRPYVITPTFYAAPVSGTCGGFLCDEMVRACRRCQPAVAYDATICNRQGHFIHDIQFREGVVPSGSGVRHTACALGPAARHCLGCNAALHFSNDTLHPPPPLQTCRASSDGNGPGPGWLLQGLGKTLQSLMLILSNPPPQVRVRAQPGRGCWRGPRQRVSRLFLASPGRLLPALTRQDPASSSPAPCASLHPAPPRAPLWVHACRAGRLRRCLHAPPTAPAPTACSARRQTLTSPFPSAPRSWSCPWVVWPLGATVRRGEGAAAGWSGTARPLF